MHKKNIIIFCIIPLFVFILFFISFLNNQVKINNTFQAIIKNKDGVSIANKACFFYESLFITEFLMTKKNIITHACFSNNENETIITVIYFSGDTNIDGFSISLNGKETNINVNSNNIIYLKNINNSFIYECQFIINEKIQNGYNEVALSFKSKITSNYTYIYSLEEIKDIVNNLDCTFGAQKHPEPK